MIMLKEIETDTNPTEVWREVFRGRLSANAQYAGCVAIRVHHLTDGDKQEAALALGLGRIRLEAEAGALTLDGTNDVQYFDISDYDLEETGQIAQQKRCRHRTGEESNLFCVVAPAEHQAIVISDCAACAVPSSPLICRWASHVEIEIQPGMASSQPGRQASARCGRPGGAAHDVHTIPGQCKPGGNSCWELLLFNPSHSLRQEGATAAEVLELLDHLDTVWRMQADQARLFGPGSFGQVSAVLEPVSSFSDFRTAVNDLVQLINRARPKGAADGKFLVRMEEQLKTYSEPGAAAMSKLRSIVALRANLEHSPREAAIKAAEVGLQYPGHDWASTWAQLLGIVSQAVRTVIAEVKIHADGGGQA